MLTILTATCHRKNITEKMFQSYIKLVNIIYYYSRDNCILKLELGSTFVAHSCNIGKYAGVIPAFWSSFTAFSPVQLRITKGYINWMQGKCLLSSFVASM